MVVIAINGGNMRKGEKLQPLKSSLFFHFLVDCPWESIRW